MSARVGVVLAGLAHPHAGYVLDEVDADPDLVLAAVVEPDPALRTAWAARLGAAPRHDRLGPALAGGDVDVVAIAAPYAERAALVLETLSAGCRVLADKPLCTDLDQLTAIERAASEDPAAVSVMFEKRGYPATRAVLDLVRTGRLGEVALVATTGPHQLRADGRPAWFFDPAGYGTLLGDLGVHDCDLFLLLTGETSGTVTGFARSADDPAHPGWQDRGALLISGDRAAATIEAHWRWPAGSAHHGHYRMRVTGTAATVEVDWVKQTVHLVTAEADAHPLLLPRGQRPAEDAIAAIRAGRPGEVTTAASIDATRLALLAARSAQRGGVAESWTILAPHQPTCRPH